MKRSEPGGVRVRWSGAELQENIFVKMLLLFWRKMTSGPLKFSSRASKTVTEVKVS